MICQCSCHKKPSAGMCICCPDAGKTLFSAATTSEDKSKTLLDSWLKGKK